VYVLRYRPVNFVRVDWSTLMYGPVRFGLCFLTRWRLVTRPATSLLYDAWLMTTGRRRIVKDRERRSATAEGVRRGGERCKMTTDDTLVPEVDIGSRGGRNIDIPLSLPCLIDISSASGRRSCLTL
jgi:hypothetical protein